MAALGHAREGAQSKREFDHARAWNLARDAGIGIDHGHLILLCDEVRNPTLRDRTARVGDIADMHGYWSVQGEQQILAIAGR